MEIGLEQVEQFQHKILDRYRDNKRDLPRRDTFDGYKILLSEVMSQQTQVERVVNKYHLFLEELPSLEDLASVDKPTLFRLRSGLWFNSRAIRLQQTAQILLEQHDWTLPSDRDLLLDLPGIWPYTSASLLAFTYNIEVPVVDTNIRRVLIRELWMDADMSQKELEQIAQQCIPEWKSNDWHNALMDYGSLVATAKSTWIKPLSKQSKFEWSPRQTRWRILKHLIAHGPTSLSSLQNMYRHIKFNEIILWMARDGIIHLRWDEVSLE